MGAAMTRVLLITGARSLADDPAAEAWARGLIAEALAGVGLLLVGDAPGPDAWAAMDSGATSSLVSERVLWIYCACGPNAGAIVKWHRCLWSRRQWALPGTSTHPLKRNAAMVADCKRFAAADPTVSVLALLDGRKAAVVKPGEKRPTRGTEHTARLARDAGLTVDARTWTPKGGA